MAVRWGYVFSILILGVGFSTYDVGTDGLNGLEFIQEKEVNRTFGPTDTIPPNCVEVENMTGLFTCMERDLWWGILTFGCIQLPGVVLAFCAAGALMMFKCGKYSDSAHVSKRMIVSALSLAIIPYPVVVWTFHLYCLCKGPTPQLELMSSVLLLGEGSLEAAPQLTLQLYIILSSPAMAVTWIQYLAIISAFLSIAKTSI